ncbi:tetratricopeptide repeat protein, partial [Microcoleus anatoxicus]|uniref:tetratricopeptide repeat protein n=1 Tax=Microcoleus anatoxicus TaxID=2705319 RepID=UPI0030C9A866
QKVINLNQSYIPAYQALVQLQPESWELWWQLGQLLEQQNQSSGAISAYQKTIELNSAHIPGYQNLLKLQTESWELWWQLGQLLEQNNRVEEAIAAYERVINLNQAYITAYEKLAQLQPYNWENWWQLGHRLAEQGNLVGSINSYRRVILINHEFSELYIKLAETLVQHRKIGEAIEVYQQATTINPDSADLYYKLGNLFVQQNKFDLAIQSYEKSITINSSLIEVYLQLVWCLRRQGQLNKDIQEEKLNKAVYWYNKALEIKPNSAEINFKLGSVLSAQVKLNDAMRAFYISNQSKFVEDRKNGIIGRICFISLPRSGTVFVGKALHNNLVNTCPFSAQQTLLASIGPYPNILWELTTAEPYNYTKSCLLSAHLPASINNLLAISLVVDRLIVNVRDPRQALLSLVHYLHTDRDVWQDQLHWFYYLNLPENYFSLSFTEQINWQMDNWYLPASIKWIEGWLDAEENTSFYPKILFTQHEELAANSQAFFERILEFYEIDKSRFTMPPPPDFQHGKHNRKGSVDEWRNVFTPEQAERASSMIPKRLLNRFGWPEK